MSVQPRSAARAPREHRDLRGRGLFVAGLTAMTAVAFGLIVYFTGTSVAWFATSPTSDPVFGGLNACLLRRLPHNRAGYAVSPDGRAAAAFDGAGVAVCRTADGGEGGPPAPKWLSLAGVTGAAWDFEGTLWLATAATKEEPTTLWRVRKGEAPDKAGQAQVVALVGHRGGVVALDAAGKLMSMKGDGQVSGYAELPRPPPDRVAMSADAAGETVSLVAGGAVWLYEAKTLAPLRAESPCRVEFLWWLPQPSRALVSCGPEESWALILDAHSGAREAAPLEDRSRSALVPGIAAYVRSCDALPCQAPAP